MAIEVNRPEKVPWYIIIGGVIVPVEGGPPSESEYAASAASYTEGYSAPVTGRSGDMVIFGGVVIPAGTGEIDNYSSSESPATSYTPEAGEDSSTPS